MTPGSACNKCDEVIEKWPDSVQADEARELIRSVLRRNARLRREREAEGKYTGQ